MTKEAIKEAIVRDINHSKFQIDFIENDKDGAISIKVSRPTKYDNHRSIKGLIRGENDLNTFREALMEQMN